MYPQITTPILRLDAVPVLRPRLKWFFLPLDINSSVRVGTQTSTHWLLVNCGQFRFLLCSRNLWKTVEISSPIATEEVGGPKRSREEKRKGKRLRLFPHFFAMRSDSSSVNRRRSSAQNLSAVESRSSSEGGVSIPERSSNQGNRACCFCWCCCCSCSWSVPPLFFHGPRVQGLSKKLN